MGKRMDFETKEHQVIQLGSLGFMRPGDLISVHLLFDLVTRVLRGTQADRMALRQTVVAGFQLFRLDAPAVIRAWSPVEGDSLERDDSYGRDETDELVEALADVPDQEDSRTLARFCDCGADWRCLL